MSHFFRYFQKISPILATASISSNVCVNDPSFQAKELVGPNASHSQTQSPHSISTPLQTLSSATNEISNNLLPSSGTKSALMQPSFNATVPGISMARTNRNKTFSRSAKLDSLVLIAGSAHPVLSKEISSLIRVPLIDSTLSRFSDGEVSIMINQSIGGKDVFIIQPCAAPVNDSIVELLLTISCARRSGARRVTAVIPYYGYKHHRRASPTSSKHQSRYLTSAAVDFAKMLQEMGVDRVIAVDLQRPGQGHEACFFDNNVPLETIVTTDHMLSYLVHSIPIQNRLVIVAPNAESMKRARNFQLGFQRAYDTNDVQLAMFESKESGSGPADTSLLQLMGNPQIDGADVIIVDDMIDTAITLTNVSNKLVAAGAKNIYICASHGIFSEDSMKLIECGPVKKVIVTNTLPLPANNISNKIEVVSVAEMLSHVILAEHFRSVKGHLNYILEDEEFEMD